MSGRGAHDHDGDRERGGGGKEERVTEAVGSHQSNTAAPVELW